MFKALSYDQVYLIPQYSPVHSRSEISTSVTFGPRTFRSVAVPANMKCTIDETQAKWMSENGHFYIMHRFGKTEETKYDDMFRFIERANIEKWKTISISIGVQEADKELLRRCLKAMCRIDYITLDIAHADSIRAREMLEYIEKMNVIDYAPFVIAGNVATPDAVVNLTEWGADAVKVGIAQGGACTTYGKTGFGIPMFSCMLECSNASKVPLIADGGIKTNGDFAKAIRAGGTMVMAGSLFAACSDSPAPTFNGKKMYYGSASSWNKGHNAHHVEGTVVYLDVDELTYAGKFDEIGEDLQSACSYAGGSMEKLTTVPWGIR